MLHSLRSPALSNAMLDSLATRAAHNGRRRQHHNVHADYGDPCQRLFNAVLKGSYFAPHRHSGATGEETLVAIRGAFLAVLFDDSGAIEHVAPCGDGNTHVGIVVPANTWHCIIPQTDTVVLFEVKAGPFDPQRAKEFAAWAPAEGDADASAYLTHLEQCCHDWLRNVDAHSGGYQA